MTEQQHPTGYPSYRQIQRFMFEAGFEIQDPDLEFAFPHPEFMKLAARIADYELEACCEFANECYGGDYAAKLRRHRRPKAKSLAEEALEELQLMEGAMYSADLGCDFSATRRALERLQELEGQK